MTWKRLDTGVVCTPEHLEELKNLAAVAQLDLPADVDKGPIRWPEGPWEPVALRCHHLATVVYALPDIRGFYGVDERGQFVTYSDVPDFCDHSGDAGGLTNDRGFRKCTVCEESYKVSK